MNGSPPLGLLFFSGFLSHEFRLDRRGFIFVESDPTFFVDTGVAAEIALVRFESVGTSKASCRGSEVDRGAAGREQGGPRREPKPQEGL
jgi:hypothetical protein